MRKLVIFFYIIFIRWWISLLSNIFYWITHLRELDNALKEKSRLKDYASFFYGVKKALQAYKWKSDPMKGLLDWSPWPITVISKRMQDDCDGAARLARWLCRYSKQVESAHEYIIVDGWNIKSAHVICIGKYADKPNWFCFNVNQLFDAVSFEAVFNEFRTKILTGYGRYKDLAYCKLR